MTVTAWAAALGLLTLPAWAWALASGGPKITDSYHWSQPWQLAVSSAAGLLLIIGTPPLIHAATLPDRRLLALLRG